MEKYEDIADNLEVEISEYLGKASEGELSESSMNEIRRMLAIVGDLERVADLCFQMSKVIERKREGKIWFTPDQRDNLRHMFELVESALIHMEKHLSESSSRAHLEKAKELENDINEYRNELRKGYLKNLNKGNYPIQSGIIYNDIFSTFEKIGDHVANISETMVVSPELAKG